MEKIIIRIGDNAPAKVSWAILAKDDSVSIAEGSLTDAAFQCQDRTVIVLLPGQDVLLTGVALPGSKKHSLRAIPYALEDRLADDIEDLHFAHASPDGSGTTPVAVVHKSRMGAWQQMLVAAQIDADVMIPEHLALPFDDGSITIMGDNGLALVRTGPDEGFVIEDDSLPPLLMQYSGEPRKSLRLMHYPVEMLQDDALRQLVAVHGPVPVTAMEIFAEGLKYNVPGGLNLLQGEYAKHAEWKGAWEKWRVPVLLLAVVVVLNGVLLAYEYFTLRAESRTLSSRIEEVLLEAFPDTRNIVNPRSQMEHKLNLLKVTQSGENHLLKLLETIGPFLAQTPGFVLKSLRYGEQDLDLDISVSDLTSLDDLKAKLLKQSGLHIEVKTAASKEGHVAARLQIRGGSR